MQTIIVLHLRDKNAKWTSPRRRQWQSEDASYSPPLAAPSQPHVSSSTSWETLILTAVGGTDYSFRVKTSGKAPWFVSLYTGLGNSLTKYFCTTNSIKNSLWNTTFIRTPNSNPGTTRTRTTVWLENMLRTGNVVLLVEYLSKIQEILGLVQHLVAGGRSSRN